MLNDIDITHITPVIVRPNYKGKGKGKLLQITIPAHIRNKFGIKKGDTLLLLANEKEIKIFTKDEYMKRLAD